MAAVPLLDTNIESNVIQFIRRPWCRSNAATTSLIGTPVAAQTSR
jgi:hypothetical protein